MKGRNKNVGNNGILVWSEVKKRFPTLTYKICLLGENQLPYVDDENTGYTVFTEITIDGLVKTINYENEQAIKKI